MTKLDPSAQLRRTTYTVSASESGVKRLAAASASRLGTGALVQAMIRPLLVLWQYGTSAVGLGGGGVAQPASRPAATSAETTRSRWVLMAVTSR
jgi:hypothetical protein